MQKQNGNFLLQALLALTLVFAFMPFLANKLAARDMSAKMYSAKTSIETLHDVARVYLRDKSIQDGFNYGNTNYSGQTLIDTLMPYGLPSGFNTTTSLNQNISLDINKEAKENGNGYALEANVVATRGDLSDYQLAELARMVGFFAHASDGNVYVSVPVDTIYSDIVSRRETDEQVGFLTELDMNWNRIENVGELHAESGNFYRARIDVLTLMGDGSSTNANVFGTLKADRGRFYKKDSSSTALSVNTSSLTVDNAELQSIGGYGDYLNKLNISVGGNIGKVDATSGLALSQMEKIDIYGKPTVICGEVKFGSSDRPVDLAIGSNFSAVSATGVAADVVVEKNLYAIGTIYDTSSGGNGISTKMLFAPKVSFSNKTVAELKSDSDSGIQVVIAPSGVSEFPDVLLPDCSGSCWMEKLRLIVDPKDLNNSNTINGCKTVLSQALNMPLSGGMNTSVMQNILCRYVYLERAERRINQVLCQYGNRSGCDNVRD